MDAHADVGTYLDCGTDFTSLSGCLVPGLFPPDSTDVSDATPSSGSGSGSGYHAVYSCSTASTHTAPCNSHHSESPFDAGSLDVQLDLDSSPGIHTDLSVALRETFGDGMRLLPGEVGSSSTIETTGTADVEEIEPWILALAAKPILHDPPALVEHSGMQLPAPLSFHYRNPITYLPNAPRSSVNYLFLTSSNFYDSFGVVQTLFRAFRSWPRMLAKGIQLPPVIHFFQYCCDGKRDFGNGGDEGMPKHISRCITLCKMWIGQAEDSGQIVQSAARGEIESILAKVRVRTRRSIHQSSRVLLIIYAPFLLMCLLD